MDIFQNITELRLFQICKTQLFCMTFQFLIKIEHISRRHEILNKVEMKEFEFEDQFSTLLLDYLTVKINCF